MSIACAAEVCGRLAAALADPHFGPSRAEGFAALCAVVPTHHNDLEPLLAAELAALDLAWAGLDEPAPPLRLYARQGVVDTALERRDSLSNRAPLCARSW